MRLRAVEEASDIGVIERTGEYRGVYHVLGGTQDNSSLRGKSPHSFPALMVALGQELTRIPIPGRRERYTAKEGPDTWWPTPEPPHRINQIFLEPILLEHAAALPNVRLLNRTQLTDFHVTVARGRDYTDVTPLKGMVTGGGGTSGLQVQVEVTQTA